MSGTHNTSHGDNHGTQVQIGSVAGSVSIHQSEPRTVRLLPQRETSAFQNRSGELAQLDTLFERAKEGTGSWLWSLVGEAAVGKTTLALTWIILNRHRFGHAQIAMACGGDPGAGRGRGVEQVCDEYFHAAGVDPTRRGSTAWRASSASSGSTPREGPWSCCWTTSARPRRSNRSCPTCPGRS
ncbi:ATP-binding protein [Nocardiopsis oceani]